MRTSEPNRTPVLRIMALVEPTAIFGAAKAVLEFGYEALRRQSIELSIQTFVRGGQERNTFTETVREAGIPLDIVHEAGRFDRAVVPQLHQILERRQAHLVWSNSVKSHFLVRWSGLDRKVAWVAAHHGYTATDWKMLAYNQLDRWSLPAASSVLTVCRPFAAQLERIGIPDDRIAIRHMSIRPYPEPPPDEIIGLRRELGLEPRESVVLSVGRLSKEKGHAELLRAFARVTTLHPEARLVLAGDGPERAALQTLRQSLGLESKVILAGHRDRILPFYRLASVFALPSHTEGSPNVLLEAMSAGVPVVATRVGGIPELATHEESGLLVESRNPYALADAIIRLMTDQALRGCVIAGGHRVVSSHTPDTYYEDIAAVLREAAQRRKLV